MGVAQPYGGSLENLGIAWSGSCEIDGIRMPNETPKKEVGQLSVIN